MDVILSLTDCVEQGKIDVDAGSIGMKFSMRSWKVQAKQGLDSQEKKIIEKLIEKCIEICYTGKMKKLE